MSSSTSVPTTSYFGSPEGLYTLVLNLNATTSSSNANFLGSSAPVSSTTGIQLPTIPLEPISIPPPLNDSRMSVVLVKYPGKDSNNSSNGLGMSMGLRTRKENNGELNSMMGNGLNSPTGLTSPTLNGGFSMTPSLSQGGSNTISARDNSPRDRDELDSPGGAPLYSLPTPIAGSTTPTLKKKPLGSSFSIPSLGSSNNNNNSNGIEVSSRPIRQFRGTSSTFVRSWEGIPLSHALLKGLAETNAGKEAAFAFYTQGKGVMWTEIVPGRPKDNLCKVTFSVAPTCIDVCQATATHQQLDVLVGFATGDVFWFDPLCAKYTRLNKSGIITCSPVTSIKWLPPSPGANHHNYFVSSHADGTMLIWDKDREDTTFIPSLPPATILHPSNDRGNSSSTRIEKMAPVSKEAPAGMGDLLVTRPIIGVDKKGVSTAKYNPVSHWRVSKKAIKDFSFSPDAQYCAVVGDDGCLRIIDTGLESLQEAFAGYFGALRTVSWSPDGRFVVTGGQDDLCTVYAPLEQRLVARCQGHSSFVTSVAWDPWRSDETTLRFGSVSEDCKLILWDLSSAALSRPKTHHGPYNHRHSTSSHLSLARRRPGESISDQLPLTDGDNRLGPTFHPAPLRSDVAILEPIMMKVLSQHNDLFSELIFLPLILITLSRTGVIQVYDRPPVQSYESGLQGLTSEFAASEVRIDARAR